MKPDSVLDRVQAARHEISDRVGHDPKKLVEYYMKRQRDLTERLAPPKREVVEGERGGGTR